MQINASMSGEMSATRARWILVAILLLGFILSVLVFTGYEAGDDGQYISIAYEFTQGRFDARVDFAQARLGMTGPLALLFVTVGPSLWTVAVIPLFWSLVCIGLAYSIGKVVYRDDRTALLAALLTAVFPLHVIMSTQYFPDLGVAALTGTAFLCWYLAEQRNNWMLYFAAGVATGMAYMYRETGLFILLPLFLYLIWRRRWRNGYLVAIGALLLVVLLEWSALGLLFGDPLYRVHSLLKINSGPAIAADRIRASLDEVRPGGVVFSPLVSLVTNQEYGLFYIFIVWATASLLFRRDKVSAPVLLFFITVAAYTLWGPAKLQQYAHLRPWPRYMAIATVPGVLLLARWLTYCVSRRWRMALVGLLIVSSSACIYLDNCRTARSVGLKLRVFREQNPGTLLTLPGPAYKGASGLALRIDPSLKIVQDRETLQDCFAVVPYAKGLSVPSHWQKVEPLMRTRRWFAGPLEDLGSVFAFLASRLSPQEGYVVYRVSSPLVQLTSF
jgi:hypothetical protein